MGNRYKRYDWEDRGSSGLNVVEGKDIPYEEIGNEGDHSEAEDDGNVAKDLN